MEHPNRSKLRQNLEDYFSITELQSLCDDLSIEDENLERKSKPVFIRELVKYCERHGKTEQLVNRCRELRSHITWLYIPKTPAREQTKKTAIKKALTAPTKKGKLSSSKMFVGFIAILLLVCCAGFFFSLNALSGWINGEETPTPIAVVDSTENPPVATITEPPIIATLLPPPTSTPLPIATPTVIPEQTIPPAPPVGLLRSCQEILANGQSVGDDYYMIDADGPSGRLEPFEVYCDMTRQGGGWTLYAYHTDGIKVFEVANVTKTEPGIMQGEQWRAVRDNMSTGMMFVDEFGKVTTLSAIKLNRANCQNIQNPESLLPPSGSSAQVWHDEDSGCNLVGQDYSFIGIQGPPYALYATNGASLAQRSAEKFDIWPYKTNVSFNDQNELFYYIK